MKAYWGRRNELRAFLTSSIDFELHATTVLPTVLVGEETGWASETVSKRWG
jgi:hypothetical protein